VEGDGVPDEAEAVRGPEEVGGGVLDEGEGCGEEVSQFSLLDKGQRTWGICMMNFVHCLPTGGYLYGGKAEDSPTFAPSTSKRLSRDMNFGSWLLVESPYQHFISFHSISIRFPYSF